MDPVKKELFISYRREPLSERLARDLKALIEAHFPFLQVMLDTKEVRTGASIKAYMDRLTQGNYIIFLLSPAFLDSHWCMYELALTADYPDFKERIFHVRLPGVQIGNPNEVAKITKSWKERYAELKADMEDIAEIDEAHLAPEFADQLRIMGAIVRGSGRALLHLLDTVGLSADNNGEINWSELLIYLKDWVQVAAEPFSPVIRQALADMRALPTGVHQPAHGHLPAQAIQAFRLGRHPVTQAQWQAVMGTNPSHFQSEKAPVECVSWEDCQGFLSQLNALTGRAFRLPTEMEWEYAAAAGTPALAHAALIVHDEHSKWQSQPVGGRTANAFGLEDMCGNVFEWCADEYHDGEIGPRGLRVIRGGAWMSHINDCNPFARHNEHADTRHPAIGFRLAEDV